MQLREVVAKGLAMFDYFAILIPISALVIILTILRFKKENWDFVLEKEYFSLLITLPTLLLAILSFVYTRQIDASQLKIAREKEKLEHGLRKLFQGVTFDFKLTKSVDDWRLEIWYEKTPETFTPKSIKLFVVPVLCDRSKKPKEYISLEELRKQDLIVRIKDERVVFRNNRCQITMIMKTINEKTNVRNYMDSKQLCCEGIGVEVHYNEIEGYLEPLKYFNMKYFEGGQ